MSKEQLQIVDQQKLFCDNYLPHFNATKLLKKPVFKKACSATGFLSVKKC
jgi:hypothetical protein